MQSPPALTATDLVCFSHLRWNFVFQRPQHLLTRAARTFRVHFIEEPRIEPVREARLERTAAGAGITVVVPILPEVMTPAERDWAQQRLITNYVRKDCANPGIGWYYTPMALRFTRSLHFPVCVYDCMDELSNFMGAPPELVALEQELLNRADVVFSGGHALYEAKRKRHDNVHAFPSSIDVAHFMPARSAHLAEPADLRAIARPRIGYVGVIDERLDYALIDGIAAARPDWQIVMVGPVVKVDPNGLPRRDNIHWLGGKAYAELPSYLSSLNAAFMPFALNAATKFISPTKTPEFLAAGLPVMSTAVADVVRSWGQVVEIAADTGSAVVSLDKLLQRHDRTEWLARVDAKLRATSWDRTWSSMLDQIELVGATTRSLPKVRALEMQVSHV